MRIALWTGGTLLLIVVAVVAAGFFLFYHDYTQLSTPPPSFRAAEKQIDNLPEAGAPAIALVIGSDHRYTDGSAPARSDTLMLVRLDPRTHLISLLSLPRDLWVNIPGYGQDKINAAYSDGGPKLTLETVKELTGLHVNYLIGVNFHSFVSLVNNLGGVYIPVDEAYIHTEAANNALPPGERWSVINLLPGYQLLNGANALAFSRFRHTDSDFYRNARQQTFLHAFEQKVSDRFHGISLTDLGTIRSIIDTISGNVDVAGAHGGIGIQTMIRYATLAYASRGHLIASRLQAGTGMIGAASVVETTPEAMQQAVFAFTHPQNIPVADEPASDRAHPPQDEAPVGARGGAGDSVALDPERHREDGRGGRDRTADRQVRVPDVVGQRADAVLPADLGVLRLGPRPRRHRRRPHHRPRRPDGPAAEHDRVGRGRRRRDRERLPGQARRHRAEGAPGRRRRSRRHHPRQPGLPDRVPRR